MTDTLFEFAAAEARAHAEAAKLFHKNDLEIDMSTLTICQKCECEVETVTRCVVCNGLFCEECNMMKPCDLCEQQVCPDCRIESNYNMAVVCVLCFDRLLVTDANWKSLTQSLSEITDKASNVEDNSRAYTRMLGKVMGRLEFLKAQYGF